MKRILVATDFSASAQFAVDRAGQLARAWGADLDLLHVPARGRWPQGSTREWLQSELGQAFTLEHSADLPFLIREHARKYQWSVALGTRWRRRA